MYEARTEDEMEHERPYVTDPAAARFCEALLALVDAQQALDAERIDLADRAGMVATMGDNGADTIDLIGRLLRRMPGRDDDDRRGERGPRPDRMARELR